MNKIEDGSVAKEDVSAGEKATAITVMLVFALVAVPTIWSVSKSDSNPPSSQPAVVQPAVRHNITVRQQAVKEVGGKYRYFFVIKNEDMTPFNGEVNIQLVNAKGEDVFDETFTTTQTMQPGDATSQFIDAHTGPSSVHGEYGVKSFKYTVKSS